MKGLVLDLHQTSLVSQIPMFFSFYEPPFYLEKLFSNKYASRSLPASENIVHKESGMFSTGSDDILKFCI